MFSVLDNVTTTQGVSFSQIITWQIIIFGMFITVILGLFVYMNTRFSEASTERRRIEDKTDKLIKASNDLKASNNDLKMSLFLIKDKLGIPLEISFILSKYRGYPTSIKATG